MFVLSCERLRLEYVLLRSVHYANLFYIVKLGFTGVYLFFLIFDPKHTLLLHVRTASLRQFKLAETVQTCIHNQCFEQKYLKYQFFSNENFLFLQLSYVYYLGECFNNVDHGLQSAYGFYTAATHGKYILHRAWAQRCETGFRDLCTRHLYSSGPRIAGILT